MRKKSNTEKNITPEIIYTAPWRLTEVKPLENYKLEVRFTDDLHGFVEMKQLILSKNAGVFAQLKDVQNFNAVFIQHGAVTWACEVDLAPDAMHDEIKQNGTWVLK
jgi:hypothetical protein